MKFYHGILTFFILFHLQDDLWSEETGVVTSNSNKEDTNKSSLAEVEYGGLEKIRLFDGSELTGRLIKLNKNQNLHWENKAASGPINFKFKSVSNIVFNRLTQNQIPPELKSLRLYLRNGDKLRCRFKQLTDNHFFVETGFSNSLKIPLFAVRKVEFLPSTHLTLYDSSVGLKNWKKSNSKSWSYQDGDLVSVFSGSVGTKLAKKEALEIEFKAEWERSFYLALRIFSDSDGSSYGNVGYHLSFSNNRLNLQVNKRKKGRIIRETLGSIMVKDMMENKKATFRILAHRQKKEFIIFVNDKKIARWKDSTQDFQPEQNGILFINQGGNSYIRLKEVNISGWDGNFFPSERRENNATKSSNYLVFNNGDSTPVSSITGKEQAFLVNTKRGSFTIPLKRIRHIIFTSAKPKLSLTETNEKLLLAQSLGRISFKLNSITKQNLFGVHPYFGDFTLSLKNCRQLKCNEHLLRRIKYLEGLKEVQEALHLQKPDVAISTLGQLSSEQRSWYWNRLSFLAKSMQSQEILSFTPHPDKGLLSTSFAGKSQTILSTSNGGEYTLWDGHAKLASGIFTSGKVNPSEMGRFSNEEQQAVQITHPYWLGETEITQAQFTAVMTPNKNNLQEGNFSLPMICNWFDAQGFCAKLNELEATPPGYSWRLPTEAEWERACRSDSTGPFCFSKTEDFPNNENLHQEQLSKYGWFIQNARGKIHPVKQKLPNAFDLYDMHGNLWEWCLDATAKEKSEFLKNRIPGAINPYSKKGDWRVLRGGCYDLDFTRCRSAYRGANSPATVNGDRGFRIALGPEQHGEHNTTMPKDHRRIINLEKYQLKLKPISPKTFLMGSPSELTAPKAIISSSGDKLITGSTSGQLGVTDFSGLAIKIIADLNSSISSLCSSPDNQFIIAGCKNGNVYLFGDKPLTLIRSFKDHQFPVTDVSISPKNERFVSTSLDGTINSYLLPTLKQEWKIFARDHNVSFDSVEYNSLGTKLLTSGIGSVPKLFNAKTGNNIQLMKFPYLEIIKSRFLPNRNAFVSVTQSGKLIFTETSNGLVYKVIRLPLQNLFDFDFSHFGKKMIFSTSEGSCSIRKTPIENTICIKSRENNTVFSPDYYFALANKTEPKQTQLSEFLSKHGFKTQDGLEQQGCKKSPNNKLVLTVVDGALRLWDSETGIWITTLGDKFVTPFEDCAFSPDGTMVAGKLKTKEFLIYLTSNQLPTYPDINKQSRVETWF
jgi:formylglycine-generating enzyme required for sulfatase activity/WD40 repeat protein